MFQLYYTVLLVVVSNIVIFHPYLGEMMKKLTNMFQLMVWGPVVWEDSYRDTPKNPKYPNQISFSGIQ